MSADNNHFMNREIQALQQEEPRQDAKAELILALLKDKREKRMSVLRKVSVPTLVSIAAIAGVFYVAQPRVVAATPDRVIKAIQDIKNYTINSFTINGKERRLQSKTTVNGKERHTVYYDAAGKETAQPENHAFVMMKDTPMGMGFKVGPDGNLTTMSKDDIREVKFKVRLDGNKSGSDANSGEVRVMKSDEGMSKTDVRVEVKIGADGKEEKHFFVNGKEVNKLPEGTEAHFKVTNDKGANPHNQEVRVEVTKGADGKEVKHFYVNGKEVDKLPDEIHAQVLTQPSGGKQEVRVEVKKDANGQETKHFYLNGKEVDESSANIKIKRDAANAISGEVTAVGVGKNGHVITNMTKSLAVVSGKDGKPMVVQSGQTSADYLITLLKDTSKWTIERGITFNGQKLDKFTLKGPVSPIVLYVDPASALPKVLRFETPMQEDTIIEDDYIYGIQP